MRRPLLIAAFSALSIGIVHCVADDPTDTGTADQSDASTNGDSSNTNDGSSGGDGATNNDGSPGITDACLATPANCPSAVEGGNIRLWLRGNVGVTCTSGQVAKWADQSGAGNDGLPSTYPFPGDRVAPAPHCGSATIAGHDVVTFTAPAQDAGPYLDETLKSNTLWLLNSEYTFFVVHRRHVDGTFGLVAQDDSLSPMCKLLPSGGGAVVQTAFAFGFEPFDGDAGPNTLYYAHHCGPGTAVGPTGAADASTFAASTVEVDEITFTTAFGHQLYANGVPLLATETDPNDRHEIGGLPANDAGLQGYIGRASEATVDTRYNGDIAEVIGYATALSDDERGQIEAYLKLQWGLAF